MNMPKRTRTHQLETESEVALNALVPSAWVVRGVDGDYGIDKEIEIFDGENATGELIKVQLKSTDSLPNKKGEYAVTIDAEKFPYWRHVDVPVLVVLYATHDRAIFARWAQSYDSFGKKEGAKTATFRFTPTDRLDREVLVERLRSELNLIRAIRKGKSPNRISMKIDIQYTPRGIDPGALKARLRLALRPYGDLLQVTDSNSADIRLTTAKGRISVVMRGNIASTTLHTDEKRYFGPSGRPAMIRSDAMMVLAMFFLSMGRSRDASRIALAFAESSQIHDFPHAIGAIFDDFLAEGLLTEAWYLIRDPYTKSSEGMRRSADMWLMELVMHKKLGLLNAAARADMIESVKQRASALVADGDAEYAGKLYYTIGHVYGAGGDTELALAAFLQAKEVDPSYMTRAYYLREVAGLYFEESKYDSAAEFYRHAVEIGGAPESTFLLADSLMRAGRYKDAAGIQISPDDMHEYYRPGARIQALIAAAVFGVVGLDKQDRKFLTEEIFASVGPEPTTQDLLSLLRQWDALEPGVWLPLSFQQEDGPAAFLCTLVAAEFYVDKAEVWVLALMMAVATGQGEIVVDDICRHAFRNCDGEAIMTVIDGIEASDSDLIGEVRAAVVRFSEAPPLSRPRVIRLHSPGGSFDEFDPDNAEDQELLDIMKFVSTLPDEMLTLIADPPEEE